MIGIYVLKTSNHFYIGLSSDLNKREYQHFSKLERNEHPNQKLQNVYNKGYKIEFEIIQECEIEDLNRLEIFWMDLYSILHSELKILNLKSGGNRPTYSYEAKETISKSKCIKDYDFEKRYIVIREENEELLFVGTALEISKYLKIDLPWLLSTNNHWSNVLNCKINFLEELNSDITDWINDIYYI